MGAGLEAAGHKDVAILSYAAKYASAYYGPSAMLGVRRAEGRQEDLPEPWHLRRGAPARRARSSEGADMVWSSRDAPFNVCARVKAARR